MTCRLCDGAVSEMFRALVLGKYDVSYECCAECGSLQTEVPYWLDEAYATHHLASVDTGPVLRSLNCQAFVWAAARLLDLPKRASVLDFGGGNGLLCRLLRDRGLDARVSDEHAVNDFAQGFEDDGSTYDIVCAFEVVEHLANPKHDVGKILGRSRTLCIVGTDTYTGQGSDWWYLTPYYGQHIFFYSQEGLSKLAAMYGYHYFCSNNFHLFLRRPFSRIERFALRLLTQPKYLRWARAYMGYTLTFDRAMEDFAALQLRAK